MPAGEGASLPGWDGTVKSTEPTPWVPAGLSLWEISVSKDAEKKATRDYEKRTSTPDGSPTTSAGYVALSLRTWLKRDQWANARTDDRWQRVLAYGLDNIDLWLEAAPVTQAWLSVERGFHPYGYGSAEQWWDAWASQTNPRLPDAVLLAGREEQAKNLVGRLHGGPQVTTIRGRSRDEVRGFIVSAVARQSAGLKGEQLLARMALVDDLASWRELLGRSAPLVLIPMRQEFALDRPASSPHHVVIPLTDGPADIELPRVDAAAVTVTLNEAGLEEEEAKKSGYLARRSLEALRLRLAVNRVLLTPDWAMPPVSRVSRSVLLAGSWADETEGDQEVLCALTGMPYESVRDELNHLQHDEHPLIDSIDDKWHLVSPEDAWEFLASALTKDDLDRLRAAAVRVLGERDPAFDLVPGERWMANVMGKTRAYSASLRSGLARSLALLTIHSETVQAPGRRNGAYWASSVARDLFPKTTDRSAADMWASLADTLPLLAEAAPKAFIDAVREGLQGDDPPLASMFTDGDVDGPSWTNKSAHPFLLWALERLAWSTDRFAAVAEILADLDRIDPGGRIMNRPSASLEGLFYLWQRGTTVPAQGRLEVLDRLRRRHPECSWRLMVALIPKRGDSLHLIEKPEFRDWKTETSMAFSEKHLFIESLLDRLIADTTASPLRFGELIERTTDLSPESRTRIIEAFDARVIESTLVIDERQELRAGILKLVRKHQNFPYHDWALPDTQVVQLEAIARRIGPRDVMSDSLWLFESRFPIVPGFKRASDEHDQQLATLRQEAVVAIHARDGLDGIVVLATRSSQSSRVWLSPIGTALSDGFGKRLGPDMLSWLSHDRTDNKHEIAQSYFARRFRESGWTWLSKLLDQGGLTDDQKGQLLLHTEAEPKTWKIVNSLGPAVELSYWRSFRIAGRGSDFRDVDLVAEQLLNVGRLQSALDLLSLYGIQSEKSARYAFQALEGIKAGDLSHPNLLDRYGIQKIFEEMNSYRDTVGERELALLEWSYLPVFNPDSPPTEILYQLLRYDPTFFVEIVNMIYLPRHRDRTLDRKLHEQEKANRASSARRAHRLLWSWNWTRDDSEDESAELSRFRKWITEARQLLTPILHGVGGGGGWFDTGMPF